MTGKDPVPDPLEDWEEGSVFGVSEDRDPVCTIPVEEWRCSISRLSPHLMCRYLRGWWTRLSVQDAASIVVRKAAEQRRHVIMVGEPGTEVNAGSFYDRVPSA